MRMIPNRFPDLAVYYTVRPGQKQTFEYPGFPAEVGFENILFIYDPPFGFIKEFAFDMVLESLLIETLRSEIEKEILNG